MLSLRTSTETAQEYDDQSNIENISAYEKDDLSFNLNVMLHWKKPGTHFGQTGGTQ